MGPKKLIWLSVFGFVLAVSIGCRKDPIERLSDPLPDGTVPQSSGVFTIYDDELKTGGGTGFIPGGENQSVNFRSLENSQEGRASARYEWNGQDVMNSTTPQHLFAGFSLLVSPDFTTFDNTAGRNLSPAGYQSLKLFVRGSLSTATSLRIEGPSTGASSFTPARVELSSLGSVWQEVTLAVPPGDFGDVKVFMTLSLQYAQPPRTTDAGNGGVVYLDDIRYVR